MENQEDKLYYMEGFEAPETPSQGNDPESWETTRVVGTAIPRVDSYQRVSGTAVYPSDVILPGMLFAAILGCPHPHARVKSVDISKAKKMPGVRAIISGSNGGTDIAWTYRGQGQTKLFDPVCRYEGDAVAAVAAETPYQAWDALRAIDVAYEVLPFVSDFEHALDEDTPKVHESGNQVGEPEVTERGDVQKGFAEAEVVVEEEYRTQCQIHTPMELHGCVAAWEGDELTIWESTQGVFAVQSEIAQALGMPLAKVRVSGHYMGGGFGSKLQASKYNIAAALLARQAGKPVKLFLSREQTYLIAGNRPPNVMKLKVGAKKDGSLTAIQLNALGTGGAYPAGGVQLLDFLFRDCYLCPNVKTVCTDLFINAGPARPFRAPGHPQASWALEQALDALAGRLDMDPVELRLKNIPDFSQADDGNPKYSTTYLKECLEEGARAFDWKKRKDELQHSRGEGHIRTGIGMAGAEWFVGGGWPPSTVILKLYADGSANLNMGAADIGTGTKTIMAMIVSEALGLKTHLVQIENADTETTQFSPPSGGSKTVPSDGDAVRRAAVDIKQKLLNMAAEELDAQAADLDIEGGKVVSEKDSSIGLPITELSGLKKRKVVIGVGYKQPNPANLAIRPFGAQFCEVRVNTMTGEIQVVKFLASHDSGRVMNRLTYDNQVIGGITMGIGFGTTEMRVLDESQTGKLCNKNWHDYKLPTALDVPADIVSVPIDKPDDRANSIGAKGLGEPVTIPTAPAIANAVYDATGVRVTTTPINPIQLSQLLADKKKG